MGSFFSSPKPAPAPAPVIVTPAAVPEVEAEDNAEMMAASEAERKRALLAKGRGSTLLTGSQGVIDEANTKKKTLLGQ